MIAGPASSPLVTFHACLHHFRASDPPASPGAAPLLLHPALLLPASFAACSCLAASLQFLAAYWCSMQRGSPAPQPQVFGQVRAALRQSGLALEAGAPGGCAAPGAQEQQLQDQQQQQQQQQQVPPGGPTLSAHDTLCSVLLASPGASQQEGQSGSRQEHLGAALSRFCVHVVLQPPSQQAAAATVDAMGDATALRALEVGGR